MSLILLDNLLSKAYIISNRETRSGSPNTVTDYKLAVIAWNNGGYFLRLL